MDGLRVTSLLRTVVDLAAVLHIARVRAMVEQGVLERRFSLVGVGATLGRVRRKGKPGVGKLDRVLDDLGPGDGIPNGELERLLGPVLRLAGLPAPVHEHPLPGHGARTGFVDRCWPEARMIVEVDGRMWHTRRQQMVADHDRSLQAQAAGYETTRLLWEHVAHDPEGTAATMAAVYAARRRLVRDASASRDI